MGKRRQECKWCEEKVPKDILFCDDLCERLYNDYWAARGSWNRYADQERARMEQMSKRNSVRSG